jgi:radical SAM/Cys-rich protein
MTRETAELCIRALAKTEIPNVDITGGAPELNPNFRWLVEQAVALSRHVIDRCNLSVLLLPGQADSANFLARNRVEVIASLPYFREAQTDAQRGSGVFAKSISALRKLNELGYGQPGTGLVLNLVHNPVGAFLPPQAAGHRGAVPARTRAASGRRVQQPLHHHQHAHRPLSGVSPGQRELR